MFIHIGTGERFIAHPCNLCFCYGTKNGDVSDSSFRLLSVQRDAYVSSARKRIKSKNVDLVMRGRALYIDVSELEAEWKYDSEYQTSYRSVLRSKR